MVVNEFVGAEQRSVLNIGGCLINQPRILKHCISSEIFTKKLTKKSKTQHPLTPSCKRGNGFWGIFIVFPGLSHKVCFFL